MRNKSSRAVKPYAVIFSSLAMGSFGVCAIAHGQANIDGTLNPGEGYGNTPLATQVNVTTSQSADGGGPGGPSEEASGTTSGHLTQLSNVYAYIDNSNPAAPLLDMFVGGSIGNYADTNIELALQTNPTGGVTTLAGQNLPGGLPDVQFQGFSPNVLLTLTPFTSGLGTAGNGNGTFKDLTNPSAAAVAVGSGRGVTGSGTNPNTEIGMATNQALAEIAIGAGGNPSFASVTTGMEFSIPLISLLSTGAAPLSTGYTGGPIEALLFPAVGSSSRTDNQILAPFDYGTDTNDYDYTYIGTSNSSDGNTSGRQFVSSVYPADTSAGNPGTQFFTIPAPVAVPEPASLGLLALAGTALLGRRSRKL